MSDTVIPPRPAFDMGSGTGWTAESVFNYFSYLSRGYDD